VTFNAQWFCNSSKEDVARVTIRNTSPDKRIPVDGIGSRGLPGMGSFERVSGDTELRPGLSAVWEARGNFSSGDHQGQVWVSNLPDAKDGSRLVVACGPDYEDLK